MQLYLILPVIEVLLSVGLLALLFLQGRRHTARKPFAFFLSFMALWGLFIFIMRSSSADDLSQALFWERFVFIAIASSSVSFFWFVVTLTNSRVPKYQIYGTIGIYFAVLALIPTDLIIKGMQLLWYGKAPVVGPVFVLYLLCVYAPIMLCLILLIKQIKQSKSNDERTRYQYIIAGIITMFIGGTADYLPTIGIPVYPLGIAGGILFCILNTIAMLRYGLLEIKVVLRKGAAYSLLSILVFGTFGSVILALNNVFKDVLSPLSMTITITAIFMIAALFQPVLLRLQHMVDRWFFRQRYDHIQALKQFAQSTDGDLDLNHLSVLLVNTVLNSMQCSGVYLLLPSTTGDFVTRSYNGQRERGDFSFSTDGPLAITMGYHEKMVRRDEMDIIPSLGSITKNDRSILEQNHIEMILPLKSNNKLVGMLLLCTKMAGESYANEDMQILQSVSGDIAARIESASRYENIKVKHTELQKTMEGVIYAVSAVVESRDPYTAGHQKRVAKLARAIAGEMKLSEWNMKGMHIIGLLHDVGKIAVPAEILSKPGKISNFEFNIIKNHSQIGSDILEKVEFPWPVSKAILQHHERINGSGYPNGLKERDIIIEARILGVADVVEAMSSHRPYRPALGLELALQEITKQSGILYDRDVVDACLRLLNKGEFEFDKIVSAAENNPSAPVLKN